MTPLVTWPTQPPPDGDGGGGGGSNPIADFLGDQVSSVAESAFDAAMQKVWDAGVWLLKGGFTLADNVSKVDVASAMGGEGSGALWPSMVWLSAMIALGLFFYQLASVAVRGGRGMFRAFTGPIQFGLAIAITTGMVATLLTVADGLTTMFLQTGLSPETDSFQAVLDNPEFSARLGEDPDLGGVEDGVRSMILGLAAVFGVIPAALGFALQMIFRQAAVLLLVATIPICAAGLVADSTASWFWRTLRWLLAAILLKPALAFVLVVGVNIMARAEGVAGLLAGTAILLIAVFCPMVLYRLLAFVDPGTGAGMALRSGGSSRGSSSEPGSDGGTSESINIARQVDAARSLGGGGESSAAGGEIGGSTATPAAGGGAGGAGGGAGGAGGGAGGAGGGAGGAGGGAGGAGGGAGGAGGGAASGGAAGAVGAVGGAAAAAVVGGYLLTKAAAQAAGGYASGQMAQTGVGHPGPAPSAGASGQEISSSASAANASANSTPGPHGTYAAGGESAPIESATDAAPAGQPDPSSAADSPGPEPPSTNSGPPEAGRPDSGSAPAPEGPGTEGPGNEGPGNEGPGNEGPGGDPGPPS